ncbi:hypothetical protein HHL22_03185 [Hymenobacter sp. RP-2-7]|uniref:Uncharacterized protein n=1 Tax=Hymenobacter polaris TaxID=2682546 RepID=A0A7Y0FLB3_9BACT|nr:hypothetical protein [Hymenobacter polaris]NML64201.1 hypothetical protein [Hymenobacter polaris]
MKFSLPTSVRAPLAGAATLSLLLAAASCVSTERETSTPGRSLRTVYTPPSGKGQRVSGATVLNTVQAEHAFSGAAPDKFQLQLRGPRVLSGRLYLTVLSAQGDTLHREVLPARVLQDSTALTVRDREISVLRGMNGFFNPGRFTAPAGAAPAARPATLSPTAWNTLRTDPQAVAFAYPTAQGEHHLVYSPKLGRAVVLAE